MSNVVLAGLFDEKKIFLKIKYLSIYLSIYHSLFKSIQVYSYLSLFIFNKFSFSFSENLFVELAKRHVTVYLAGNPNHANTVNWYFIKIFHILFTLSFFFRSIYIKAYIIIHTIDNVGPLQYLIINILLKFSLIVRNKNDI